MIVTPATHSAEIETLKKKTIFGTLSYFLRTGFLQAIGLGASLVLSYYLSPEDFGIYGALTAVIGVLVFFSDIGLAAALVQKRESPTELEYKTAFTIQQLLSWVIFAVVLLMVLTGYATRLAGPEAPWILLALGLSFPLASLKTIPSIILERQLLFSKLVIPQVIEQLVFQGTLIYCAVAGFGVGMYTYAVIARSVVGVLAMWVVQPWPIGFAFDRPALKVLLKFGVQFQLNDFLARIKDQLYYLFLASVLPLNQFGYIQWAKNWSSYPYSLTVQNIMAITFPTFSRLQHDTQLLTKALEKTLFFITLIILPLLVGMSLFITPLIHLVPSYEKWLPAVLTLVLFNAATVWSAISTPLTNVLNATGRIGTTLKLMIFWTVLTWGLTPLAIMYLGYNGVGVTAFIISCTSYITVYLVKKLLPLRIWDQVWRQLLAAVCMSGVGILTMQYWQESFTHLFIGMVVVGGSYGVAMGIFGWKKVIVELQSIRNSMNR